MEKGKGKGKRNKKLSDRRNEDDNEPIGASSSVDRGSQIESRHGQRRERDSSYEEFSKFQIFFIFGKVTTPMFTSSLSTPLFNKCLVVILVLFLKHMKIQKSL